MAWKIALVEIKSAIPWWIASIMKMKGEKICRGASTFDPAQVARY